MLIVTVPAVDLFDESTQKFIESPEIRLELEHSLASLSKWESIYCKPFLADAEKTTEEVIGYVKAMITGTEVPEEVFSRLTQEHFEAINSYINAPMTATWFNEAPGGPKTREVITSELIYYWLTVFQIPFEVEHWHLNRLFTLIRIANIKSAKPKKMNRKDAAQQQRDLNAQRKAQMNSSG